LGGPAPLFVTDAAPLPAGAAAEWFEGAGGARLRAALVPAAAGQRGSVVVSGGRTEPIEKYFEVAGELVGRGFTVLLHDWRGQGLSKRLLREPLKGHARGWRDFLTDYSALLAAFETRLPPPWLAVGHSMGGCLTALALAEGEQRFAGAALSAPMFGIFTQPIPRPLAGALAKGLAYLRLGGLMTPGALEAAPTPFADNVLTHDPARYAHSQDQIAANPVLALGSPTWGWLAFAFQAMSQLEKDAPRVATPLCVVAAGDDRIVDNRATRRITARFQNGDYVEAPGAFHEILQETDEIRAAFWREFDRLARRVAPQAAAGISMGSASSSSA
jgi:lysophospholipase